MIYDATKHLLAPAIGLTLLFGPAAHGQHALGQGDALDRNLGRLTGGRNLPTPIENFRTRNLIVTGDVAGGRGFRDTVGYAAEGDFRDVLGSDDLFEFRARAFPSSPQMIQFGSQQFRIGQELAAMEYRRDMAAPRVGGVSQVPGVREDVIRFDRLHDMERLLTRQTEELRLDGLTQAAGVGRALELAAEARPIGVTRGPEGIPALVSVSGLRGVLASPLEQHVSLEGFTTWDQARLMDDAAAGRLTGPVGTPFEGRFQQLAEERRLDPGRQFDPTVRDEAGEYARLLERIARQYAHRDDVDLHIDRQLLNQLDDRFAGLRNELLEREQQRLTRLDGRLPGGPEEVDPLALVQPGLELPETPVPSELPERDVAFDLTVPRDRDSREPMEIGDIAPLLRHGQRVDQLSGAARTRFNELMSLAEESLRRGDYFMAERRFVRALRFTPGHPLAMAGLAHAQIGAGLNNSAAIILQRMFIQYPEMIDTRFGPEVMPDQARTRQVMRNLEARLAEPRDRASIGFLLAYLGHQLGEREAVERGLGAMRESAPDSALLPVLEAVWLAPPDADEAQAPIAEPQPAPEPEK